MHQHRTTLLLAVLAFGMLFACRKDGKTVPPGEREILLGASFPLTGDNASYGTDARRGIDLAVEEINAAPDRKFRIAVKYEDDRVDPKIGVMNMEKLTSVDKVPLVFGSAGSNVTLAMAPVANRTRTVLLSPISSAPQITDAGPFVFRTCPSDAAQAEVVAEWVLAKGYKNIGILFVNNSWGVGLKDAFVRVLTNKGGTVVAVESSNETDPDFRSQLTRLKASSADALYMPTYSKQGGRILVQARELGLTQPIFGADTWGAPELIGTAGQAAEGVMFVVPEEFNGPRYQSFRQAFVAKYGVEPDFNASSAYDAAHVAALAIRRVIDDGKEVTGEAIAAALGAVQFAGATGLTRFDQNGDVVGKAFGRRVFKEGRAVPTE